MANDQPGTPETPEVRTIRQLVRLMQRYDLTAIDLGDGPTRIRLRRRMHEAGAAAAHHHAPVPLVPMAPVAGAPAAAVAIPTTPAPEAPRGVFIESPMVGTYYSASSPDAPPFVSVGSAIRADTTVCVIEAMKVFTDIPAGISGTITEVLVKNGQPVEYGQPLFRIEPA
jgi:acetyl-CoA carboxylase biotin carboxyl carrier protein